MNVVAMNYAYAITVTTGIFYCLYLECWTERENNTKIRLYVKCIKETTENYKAKGINYIEI